MPSIQGSYREKMRGPQEYQKQLVQEIERGIEKLRTACETMADGGWKTISKSSVS